MPVPVWRHRIIVEAQNNLAQNLLGTAEVLVLYCIASAAYLPDLSKEQKKKITCRAKQINVIDKNKNPY